MKRSQTVTKTLLLVLTAFIWGFTFSFQSMATEYVGTFTFLASRSWIAVLFLIPVIQAADKAREKRGEGSLKPNAAAGRKRLWLSGGACGAVLCLASGLQQAGIATTTTAKASFITALYVILVPVLSIFLGQKSEKKIWFCVAMSVAGLYLLCFKGGSLEGLCGGDLLMIFAALGFAVQILVVDHFVASVDPIRLSQMQVMFQGIISTVLTFILEKPSPEDLLHAAFPIIFAGILSSGVAYTLQIVGQKGLDPAIASIAMCLESVFGAIGGWVILGQKLTSREMSGCALMFAAIVLAQIPAGSFKHEKTARGRSLT